jgi:hypothetical protein
MTIPIPDVYGGEEMPDDGSSLAADPWATDWSLPSDVELKAVGWPGARPGSSNPGVLQEVREPLSPDPHPTTVEEASEPVAQPSAAEHLPPPPQAPSA